VRRSAGVLRTFGYERLIVLLALALLAALAWGYLFLAPMPMPQAAGVTAIDYAALTAVMWLLMMIAMMTPAVLPVVMLFHTVARRAQGSPAPRTLTFIAGYFTAWAAFSVLATLLQIGLILAGTVDTMGKATQPLWTAAFLVVVGAYQFLPVKATCLDHCRSPIAFLTQHYRPGLAGAWRMGLSHGSYCVGCCWMLMLLLFIGGVMNLLWVVGLTLLVVLEKLLPRGPQLSRAAGVVLLAGAAVLAGRSLLQ
jgi:predicted metal-binding membrane protein